MLEAIDPWLISIGWMFGLVFLALGLAPAFTEGGDVRLLALGIALLALGRAAAAADYARRSRWWCESSGSRGRIDADE